ncbi:MAG: hypothetical protein A3K19_06790 [Lentisphaerae bacterium RIFOXYB12_FULL_65_16]|nr:MAG: hypothetical protein A3K18_21980 [Lentisphaerae bacterium RIFOXYA12_64_32]OGV93156.1 MAG: hypothetical protein A3K19_06790 [Lentisphaerae bacterium RIFOXYB12_FULL_65_16]
MSSEADKIVQYFTEGRRVWPVNPELVVSRRFFEMWEDVHKPRPFALDSEDLTLCGLPIHLTPDDERIGSYTWDGAEACAALQVEGRTVRQKFLLMFNDGEPVVEEGPAFTDDGDGLGYGERLEVVYDVVALVRRENPACNVLELTGKEFRRVLTDLADVHERKVLTVMQRLDVPFVRKLLRRAVEDMALDELSNQLELPLGGSYAAAPALTSAATQETDVEDEPPAGLQVPRRTPWAVKSDLAFLARACRLATEHEKTVIFDLRQAEVLEGSTAAVLVVKVPVDPDVRLNEGDELPVLRRGEETHLGALNVDLHDGRAIYGRLVWKDECVGTKLDDRLYARPYRSPTGFMATCMEALCQELEKGGGGSPALQAALGLADTVFVASRSGGATAPAQLDETQQRAWAAATESGNRVVLVQGPPGTGKTSVMECVLRTLCEQGNRILVTAPSNTAVDNICRRVLDLPILRFGVRRTSMAPDIADACWVDDLEHVRGFAEKRKQLQTGGIYAGTHVGLLKSDIVQRDLAKNGFFGAVVFDEAGMTHPEEFLLCAAMGGRVILFGDHQQLPPFPMPDTVLAQLRQEQAPVPRAWWSFQSDSALQWLAEQRNFPVVLLQRSYRCQNPRLMRFASTLFYDARVRTSERAEYYRMSFAERQLRYPPSTLRLLSTSALPGKMRGEVLTLEGSKPGLENPLEACICADVVRELLKRYPPHEITVITPYRRQARRIRRLLREMQAAGTLGADGVSAEQWDTFLAKRISTVDSFQGGESDAVVISYVRSNADGSIGFIDDPNRVNVAHTRSRREMIVIGDLDFLCRQARNNVFRRLERAVRRDGELVQVTPEMVKQWA